MFFLITFLEEATSIHTYKNLKVKLMNSNANIYFSRQYLIRTIVPKYAKMIKTPDTSPAAITTQRKAQIQRIATLTSYEQYCKPHGIPFGMKNLNMYYTF
jgi:hypothetical protein